MGKTALVIGANGLIGSALIEQLIQHNDIEKIIAFVRKPLSISNSKLQVEVVDMMNPSAYSEKINGDILFCCIGTTIKTAGSQEAFSKVDFQIPVAFAKVAHQNNLPQYLMVSSLGADQNSSNFYLKTKGRCETEIAKIGLKSFSAFQPSMLLGKRTEFRLGEMIGKVIMTGLSFLFIGPIRKYKAIQGSAVAKAMIKIALQNKTGNAVYRSDEIETIAK